MPEKPPAVEVDVVKFEAILTMSISEGGNEVKQAKPSAMGRASGGSYHHGSLRNALIACGTELIGKGGHRALTLRSVAEAAGVSRQAPYHHFSDKEGLLVAIAICAFDRISNEMKESGRRARSPESRVVAIGRTYVRCAREAPQLFDLCSGSSIQDFSAYPALLAARDIARQVLEEAIREYLGDGLSSRDLRLATAGCWATAHGLARLLIDGAIVPGVDGMAREAALVEGAIRGHVRGLVRRAVDLSFGFKLDLNSKVVSLEWFHVQSRVAVYGVYFV